MKHSFIYKSLFSLVAIFAIAQSKPLDFKTLLTSENKTDQSDSGDRSKVEKLGIRYLDSQEFKMDPEKMTCISKTALGIYDRKNLEKYEPEIKNHNECPWKLEFMNQEIGYGIIAVEDIQPGDLIAEYTGVVIDFEYLETHKNYDLTYAWTITPPLYIEELKGKRFIIDAREAGNFTRYINHDYKPNVQAVPVYANDGWHMLYIACAPIKAGEQMLVDYGKGYWANRNPQSLRE